MIPGVRLVVLGKQGAGKGTQCVRLSHHYVVPHVSTGDMLRGEVKSGTPLGLQGQGPDGPGRAASPTTWSWRWWPSRLSERDTRARGFVLDGCPRTTAQAEALGRHRCAPSASTWSSTSRSPPPRCMKRLASRRVCVDCGANYSTVGPAHWSTGPATSAAARWSSARTTPRRPSSAGSTSTSARRPR